MYSIFITYQARMFMLLNYLTHWFKKKTISKILLYFHFIDEETKAWVKKFRISRVHATAFPNMAIIIITQMNLELENKIIE